jgi:hypothetical protein
MLVVETTWFEICVEQVMGIGLMESRDAQWRRRLDPAVEGLLGLGGGGGDFGDGRNDSGIDGEAANGCHDSGACRLRGRSSHAELGEQGVLKLELLVDGVVLCHSLCMELVQVGLQLRMHGGGEKDVKKIGSGRVVAWL